MKLKDGKKELVNLINRRNLQKMSGWVVVFGEKYLDGIWELDIMNVLDNGDFIEY